MKKINSMNHENSSIKVKAISGLFWSFSEFFANIGINFVIQIILANLLLPTDFGVIAIISVLLAVCDTLIDSGFTNALIRDKNTSQTDYSTVFYFNFVIGLLLYGLFFVLAGPISIFYQQPLLKTIIRVMGVIIIINSLGAIQRVRLMKNINFKTQTAISMIGSIISGVVGITMALMGYGVWSLVIRMILSCLIQVILLFLLNHWLPSLVFSMASFKRLFAYGSKILATGILGTLYNNIYPLIIGKAFSTAELGYYNNAQKLRDVASQSITTSVGRVSFPVLSTLQDDDIMLKKGYKKIVRTSVYFTFPIMIGLAAVAPSMIRLMLGDKWIPSILYFQILCLAGMLFPLHSVNLNILQVKGRSDLLLLLEFIKKGLGLALIGLVLVAKFGVVGLLWASFISNIFTYFINSYYSAELINYSTKEQLKDIFPAIGMSVIMFGVTTLIAFVINQSMGQGDPFTLNLVTVIAQVLGGVALYLGMSKRIKIEEFDTIFDIFRTLLHKS